MENENTTEVIVQLSRREFIRCGVYGTAGLLLFNGLPRIAMAAPEMPLLPNGGKAKSVIQLWMWGGPPHTDTFDPKPDAGSDYSGPLNHPMRTNVDGLMISELMPNLSKQADKFSVIRSMTHGNFGHETAAYMVQTGHHPGDGTVHPGMGAVVSYLKGQGYKGLIPPYIVLSQLLGRFSESGFLGSKAKPFATGGDPNAARFLVEGVVAEGVSDERQMARRQLMHDLDSLRSVLHDDPQLKAMADAESQAYELILGDAGKVFDLSQEKSEVRDRYGRNTFGQSCLLARRLVERGVPFVSINNGGWDTHKENFPAMKRKIPELDMGFAALLQDLAASGLLDQTVIVWGGEFGRTPKVDWNSPWNGGRGHWGSCFSSVVAGGGFKGGQVVGASDAKGEQVAHRPVYPNDLLASVYTLLGIDPNGTLPDGNGGQIPIVPGQWDPKTTGGLLKEIM